MLPSFIGIGAARCGSTWLHAVLRSHENILVPKDTKEVRYFNEYYHRGEEWYESFFNARDRAAEIRAVGEVTPHYLYSNDVPQRIYRMGTVKTLICIVRNPADRLYSAYGLQVNQGFKGSFEKYLQDAHRAIDYCNYAKYLRNYLEYYDKSQICLLVFENAVSNLENTKTTLAKFLGVPAAGFLTPAMREKVNFSYNPRYPLLNRFMRRTVDHLRARDLHWIVNAGGALGLRKMLSRGAEKLDPMKATVRARLLDELLPSIEYLEAMFDVDLRGWKVPVSGMPSLGVESRQTALPTTSRVAADHQKGL
jgi:Sulfotransferase domain